MADFRAAAAVLKPEPEPEIFRFHIRVEAKGPNGVPLVLTQEVEASTLLEAVNMVAPQWVGVFTFGAKDGIVDTTSLLTLNVTAVRLPTEENPDG